MPAGSLVLFAETLLHRGGVNRSYGMRRAFSHQYCEPSARQQENFLLSVSEKMLRDGYINSLVLDDEAVAASVRAAREADEV